MKINPIKHPFLSILFVILFASTVYAVGRAVYNIVHLQVLEFAQNDNADQTAQMTWQSDGSVVCTGVYRMGGNLSPTGTGTITATNLINSPGAISFSSIGSGANTGATMVVGSGSTLGVTGSGSISATTCSGNSATATTATNFSGSLAGDVTGTQNATVVSAVGGQTATNVAAGSVLANAATAADTPGAIVLRDGSGNFAAGSGTINNLLPAQTGNSGKVLGTNGSTTFWTTGGGGGSQTPWTSNINGAGYSLTGALNIGVTGAITGATITGAIADSGGQVFNVKTFGAVGNGTHDDTTAINNAITGAASANGGIVYFPTGQYKVTSQILVQYNSIHLRGEGRQASIIVFAPTANGTCLYFENQTPNGSLVGCSLSHMSFWCSDTTYVKTAISFGNVEEFIISDIDIGPYGYNWTDTTKSTVGLRTGGRQTITLEKMMIVADKPIEISQNPYRAGWSYIDLDHTHFSDMILQSTDQITNPIITVDTGVVLGNITFDGYQSWVWGGAGFYWNDTTGTAGNECLSFSNVRQEGTALTGTPGWLFYIHHNAGLSNVIFKNIFGGMDLNGFYFRKCTNVILDSCNFTDNNALSALNADSTVGPITLTNCSWLAGETATLTGQTLLANGPAVGPLYADAFYSNSGGSYSINGNAATASAVAFSGITAATNTNALVVGSSGSIKTTGNGYIGGGPGSGNVQLGSAAGLANTGLPSWNLMAGYYAGGSMAGTGDNYNVWLGTQAGQYANGSANGQSVGIGGNALINQTTGSFNVGIGAGCTLNAATDSNEIVIGQGATGAGPYKAVLGNASTTDVYFGSASGLASLHGFLPFNDVASGTLTNAALLVGASGSIAPTGTGNVTANILAASNTINGVSYSWTGSQGATNSVLKNDGSGNLSWYVGAVGPTGPTGPTGATGASGSVSGANYPLSISGSNVAFSNYMSRTFIDNGAMNIAQRGASGSLVANTGAIAYAMDRWAFYGDASSGNPACAWAQVAMTGSTGPFKWAGSLNAYRISGTGNLTGIEYHQRIESTFIQKANGQALYLSAWLYNNSGATIAPTLYLYSPTAADNYSGSTTLFSNQTFYAINFTGASAFLNGTWTQIGYPISPAVGSIVNGLWFNIHIPTTMGTTGNISLTQAQLELGTAATNFEVLPPAIDLIRCLRRHWRPTNSSTPYIGPGYSRSTSNFYAYVQFPVTMASAPTITTSTGGTGDFQVYGGTGTYSAQHNASYDYASTFGSQLGFSNTGAWTVGLPGNVQFQASSAYIDFSCDL